MADMLGLDDQTKAEKATPDFLGNPAVTSFKGQPSLPSHIGAPASAASTGPQTIAGSGTAAVPPGVPPSFGELAEFAMPQSGSGEGGAGSPVGIGEATGIPSFGVPGTGGHVTVGMTGNIGINTGVPALDTVLNVALGQGARAAGASTNIPSILAMITGNPVLGAIAGAAGMAGIPLTIANLGAFAASLNPSSIQSQLNALQANPNVTAQDFAQFMSQIAMGFPTEGGPQASGTAGRVALGLDNPVTNVNASTQAAATAPAANLAEATTPTPTFAALANAITGRGDQPDAGPTGPGPSGAGPGAGTASGDSSTGGDPGGSTY